MPRITVAPHTPALAADFNAVSDQSVMVFGTAAQRTAAIPTPTEGMFTYRTDADALEYWDGTGWRSAQADCYFSVYRNAANTSIGDGFNHIYFDAKVEDKQNVFTLADGNNAGQFLAPRDGLFEFFGRAGVIANPAPVSGWDVVCAVAENTTKDVTMNGWVEQARGTESSGTPGAWNPGAATGTVIARRLLVRAGRYYTLILYSQLPGGTKSLHAGNPGFTYFEGRYIR